MKLTIVILCCVCLHLVSPTKSSRHVRSPGQISDYQLSIQARNAFLDQIKDFIDNIIRDATDFLKTFTEQFTQIIEKIQSELEKIVQSAQSLVDQTNEQLKKLLQAWETEAARATNCTLAFQNSTIEAAQTLASEMQICQQNAEKIISEIQGDLQSSINNINSYVNQLGNLFNDCFANSSFFAGFSCVISKASTINANIAQLITECTNIASISINKGATMVNSSAQCYISAADKYQKLGNELQTQFIKCLLDFENSNQSENDSPSS